MLARPRLQAALVTCFAVIAVVLAVIGVYGLIAYAVTLRTHEIGIRLALGATREKVFFELFGQGAQLVFADLIVGVAGAVTLRKIASTFAFGVTTGDPVTYLFAALTFSAVAPAPSSFRHAAHLGLSRRALCVSSEGFLERRSSDAARRTSEWRLPEQACVCATWKSRKIWTS